VKKQLVKSSYFRILEILIFTITSLILTPYLINHLGNENYGLWILILSALGWFNFIDLGFSYAIQRNIMLAIEDSNNDRINVVFSVGVVLFALLGGVAALCVLCLAIFPELLNIQGESSSLAAVALSLLSLKVFLDFMMNSFHGFYGAYLRTDIDANLSTLNAIIKSVLVYLLIVNMNIYGAVLATLAADIFTHSLKIYFAKKLHPDFKFAFKLVKIGEVRELFAFSKHLIASGIASSINRKADPIVISYLFGLKYVALYNVINSLVNQVESLVMAVVGVFQPVFIKMVARGGNVNSIFKQVLSINNVAVLVVYTPLAILAENFILLWIGDEYSTVGELAFVLGFAYISRTVSRPINSLLLAQANHKLLSVVNLLGAIINIVFSLWFGSLWGLKGVAIATIFGFFISNVILHLILLKRYTDIPVLPAFFRFIYTIILFALFTLLGKYILSLFFPLSWSKLILAGGLCVLPIIIFSWLCVLNKETKFKLYDMLANRRK
jgi:O-antigen/teichoic acid export membrane protein